MALGALTLTTNAGVQGRQFSAKIVGLTTGRVEVLNDGSPGFSTVNGRVMSSGLPYAVNTVVLREYEPGVGQGYRDSRIDITAATRASLLLQAISALAQGRTLVRWHVAGTAQADGTIIYSLYVEDDLGATIVLSIGGSAPTPIAQRANSNFSWHEEVYQARSDGTATLLAGDGTGLPYALKTSLATGQGTAIKVLTGGFNTLDDHIGIAESPASYTSALLLATCGHGNSYTTDAIRNEIRVARAASGQFADLPTDRANQTIITLPSTDRPNYLQWLHIQTGPLAGRLVTFYNDDTTSSVRPHYTDDGGQTFPRGRMLFSNTIGNQTYFRLDIDGIFTGALPGSGYNSTFVPVYGFNHPSNSANTGGVTLSYTLLDLANGQVRRPDTGALALSGASIFDQTNQDTPITTLAVTENAMRFVRKLPQGDRSQRTHMVKNGVAYLTDFNFTTKNDVHHIVRKAGVDYDLGLAGAAFWTDSMYTPDIQPGREAGFTGDRVYRCYNDGTSYFSGSKLDRIDYPNGIQVDYPNSAGVTTRILTAGVTPGIAADDAILRYFPIRGAGSTGLVGWAQVVNRYNTYQDYTQGRFVPVMR